MKKALLSLILAVSFAQANDATIVSMHDMEAGLDNIQKGFLYNQPDMILSGAERISKANKMFLNVGVAQKYLPEHKKHMVGVTLRTANRVDTAIEDLKYYIQLKEYSNASKSYSAVINACTDCHAIVRGW